MNFNDSNIPEFIVDEFSDAKFDLSESSSESASESANDFSFDPPPSAANQTLDSLLAELSPAHTSAAQNFTIPTIETSQQNFANFSLPEVDSHADVDLLGKLLNDIDHIADPAPLYPVLANLPHARVKENPLDDFSDARTPLAPSKLERHIVFTLDEAHYALPVANMLEIVRPPMITSLPFTPNWLRGIANLRGDIITVVDLRIFFGLPALESARHTRMIMVRLFDEPLALGLTVDAVREMTALPIDKLKPLSAHLSNRSVPFVRGMYEHNERLLLVLDAEKLLQSAELREFEASGVGI